MDLARRPRPDHHDDGLTDDPRDEIATLADLDRVLRFTPPPVRRVPAEPQPAGQAIGARDIARAIDLVHEAARTIRSADERARSGDTRTQMLLQRATEELRTAETRIEAAETRARNAEAKLKDAERRANEAEDWLRQIFSTISEELPAQP